MMDKMDEITYENLKMHMKRMNRMKKIILCVSLLLVSGVLFGQRNILRYADMEYGLNRFEHAGSQYAEAYNRKPTYYSCKRAAESYSSIRSYEKAFEWWGKVIGFEESDRSDYLNYARAAVQAGKSLSELDIELDAAEESQVYGYRGVSENRGIDFRPLDIYNGAGTDYGLSSDAEGNRYFVSDRNVSDQTLKKPIRFDVRRRFTGDDRYRLNDRGFHNIFMDREGDLTQVSVETDGVYHLSTPTFYMNGAKHEVIFTAVLRDEKGRGSRSHEVYPGLYRAEVRSDGSFGSVQALPFNRSSSYSVMHGFVHNDRLYFSSDMPGGYGGFDLYYADLIGGICGPAVNMGEKVNGSGDEVFPYLHEGVLYFSSNRSEGMGGLDIYQVDDELVGKVGNMGKPYNSAQDDFAYFVDEEGVQYLSSDRGMSESRDDIYRIAFLFDQYSLRVFAEGGARLDGLEDLELKLTGPDGSSVALEQLDGRVAGLKEGDYLVEISGKGYFPARAPLSALVPDGREKMIDYALVPIPYGKLLDIDTVYYDLDKYNIRPDASAILDRVASLLGTYPEFNLNITSHTDSRASNAYNEKLSENRSRSAASYLGGLDISAERIRTDWMGEAKLVNPCVDGVDCPESMHDRNRRSILSLALYPKEGEGYKLPAGLEYVQSTEELMEAIASMVNDKRNQLLPVVLAEDVIYYDLDRYEIRSDADEVLQRAGALMKKYPFLKLEIASHTDSRQTPQYNDRLSKNRSMSVFFTLKDGGISPARMGVSWYNESKLVTPCEEGVSCTEEQHQLNRRSVLKLKVDRSDVDKLPVSWRSNKLTFSDLLK